MNNSETSIPAHVRAPKASPFSNQSMTLPIESQSERDSPFVPRASQEREDTDNNEKSAIIASTRQNLADSVSPEFSLGLPLLATHPAMSSFSQAKSLENGEGMDEDEKKQRESHKKRSKNWTRPESLLLICLRTQLEPRFAKSGRKTELWDEIAESLRKENYTRDAQQCRDKWEKLTAGYKEVRDGVKEKEDNPFFDELHSLLSGKSMKRDREKEREDSSKEQRELPKVDTALAEEEVEEQEPGPRQLVPPPKEDEDELEPARKKTKTKYLSVTDMEAVQSMLETLITRQQAFFWELLEAMERKEQMREQLRQEKEERWRAEERAQRGVFNNAMIALTQKLVGEQLLGASTVPGAPIAKAEPGPAVGSSPVEGHQGVPKRRSKNWKRAEVLQLIKLRGEMDSRFAHSTRRAALWEELAERLVGQGIKRDGKQCREKWDKLVAEYKDVTDGKRDQRESPYYAELTAILGEPVEAA